MEGTSAAAPPLPALTLLRPPEAVNLSTIAPIDRSATAQPKQQLMPRPFPSSTGRLVIALGSVHPRHAPLGEPGAFLVAEQSVGNSRAESRPAARETRLTQKSS